MCRFGSWTFSGDLMDLVEQTPGGALEVDDYNAACPSIVQSHRSRRNVVHYSCCEEPYVDIGMNFTLAWR